MSWMKNSKRCAELALTAFRGGTCPHHYNDCTSFHVSSKLANPSGDSRTGKGTNADKFDYAFEIYSSAIRFGIGSTKEVGMDLANLGGKRTMVLTDQNLVSKPCVQTVLESLDQHNVNFDLFEHVKIEPTDASLKEAIFFARRHNFDTFVAVGGGSTMDTGKAASIFNANPFSDFFDFVAPPFGKNLNPKNRMLPLICIPTTAGTGAETTTALAFDLEREKIKTAIRSRALKPHLAIVDPLNINTMPKLVAAHTGFDVLCHALESYTAIPYTERSPRPANPGKRPIYQGSNPISDVWIERALHQLGKNFVNSVLDPENMEAKSEMMLAASFAGMGFGNAGVHICHGLGYAIAGNVKGYMSSDYPQNEPLIPHGLSVVLTAPAAFKYTAPACPERHLRAAELLGADVSRARLEDAGDILADVIRRFMRELNVSNGLAALGYTNSDLSVLAKNALRSSPLYTLCGRPLVQDIIHEIFEQSLTSY